MITHDLIDGEQSKEQLRQYAHDLLTTLGEAQHALNSARTIDRKRQQARWDLAAKLAEDYHHHKDLAAYATMRMNGTIEGSIGTQDRSWWTLLMDESVAKRDALHSVILMVRNGLGEEVTTRSADARKGMEIYLTEFVLEGSSAAEQVDALTRMLTRQLYDDEENAIEGALVNLGRPDGMSWDRDRGDFVERDPPEITWYGSDPEGPAPPEGPIPSAD